MKKFSRRAALFGGGAVIGGWVSGQFGAAIPVLDGTRRVTPSSSQNLLNDVSGFSETPIFRHVILNQNPDEALVAAIRGEISEARAENRPVNVSAARHSMGGQSIPRNGHALTFQNSWLEPDTANETMQIHAGARWSDVITQLDPLGYGPKVMQSNNDFGVAATFCVNAHGWPVRQGPMGSTVRSCQIVVPDGDLVTCSRTENSDLFRMTMGGYGLTGAIVSMEVDIAQNARLEPVFDEMPAKEFGQRFASALKDDRVNMAYGRLNVDRANFFDQALMITYRPSDDQSDLPAAAGSGVMSKIARYIYRAQLGNEQAKRFRWWTETELGPAIGGGPATRNSLINEPVATLDDRDPDRTDILHEYFISPDRFAEFIDLCKLVIPGSFQDFLNVTLRFVDTDPDSWLAYAPEPRIAAVMSFSQELTVRADADMARMTQELIDGVIAIGGTYYLPYRPHARQDQFTRAYPRAAEFAAAKRALDPQLVFQNNLWATYLEAL